jgi:hypothetical protein
MTFVVAETWRSYHKGLSRQQHAAVIHRECSALVFRRQQIWIKDKLPPSATVNKVCVFWELCNDKLQNYGCLLGQSIRTSSQRRWGFRSGIECGVTYQWTDYPVTPRHMPVNRLFSDAPSYTRKSIIQWRRVIYQRIDYRGTPRYTPGNRSSSDAAPYSREPIIQWRRVIHQPTDYPATPRHTPANQLFSDAASYTSELIIQRRRVILQ